MCCKMKCRGISDDEELIDFLKVLNTRYGGRRQKSMQSLIQVLTGYGITII